MQKRMYKVVCPVEKKEGTGGTYWMRLGTAFINKDNSINVYCDAWPTNGKLQLREFSEEELRERDLKRANHIASQPRTLLPAGAAEGSIPF